MTDKPVYVVSDEEISAGTFSLQGGPAIPVRGWGVDTVGQRGVQGGARVPVYVVNDNAAVLARGVQGPGNGGSDVLPFDVTDAVPLRGVVGHVAIPVYVSNRNEWPDTVSPPFVRPGHTTTLDESDTTTRVIDAPTHEEADLIVIFVGDDVPNDDISSTNFDYISGAEFDTSSLTAAALKKAATGAEPATYTVTTTAEDRCALVAIAIANHGGIDAVAPIATGQSNTVTLPAVTPGAANALCVRTVFADRNVTPMGSLSGFTKITDVGIASAASVGVYYKQLTSTDEVTAATVSISDVEQWIGLTFTVGPA